MNVSCLRFGAVRLALALMLALLVVPGYVAAPILFSQLQGRALAGQLAGAMFELGNRTILILALAVALFWVRRGAGGLRWGLLAALGLLVGVNEFGLRPHLQDLKQVMGAIDTVPAADPARRAFALWHGISATLHLLASLAAALLVAVGSEDRIEPCNS